MSLSLHFLNGSGDSNGSLSPLSVTGEPKQDYPSDEQGNKVRWAALLIFLVIIPTIGGNILVILAVSLEKKLQYATNYFLMSLAVADLLVGLFVMPIGLLLVLFGNMQLDDKIYWLMLWTDLLFPFCLTAYIILTWSPLLWGWVRFGSGLHPSLAMDGARFLNIDNAWPLPTALCPIWLFLDVLFSTASIMHLCAISLDRYIAIKKPIQASQYNSWATTIIKITVVWLISIGIAIPVPIRGIEDGNGNSKNITCVLMPDRFHDFILYGSVAAFFIPLTIMIVTYFLTIQVLRKKAYLINKPPQRFTWSTVSTVFQRDTTPASSPEKVAMLNGSKKDKALSSDVPICRTSTIGRKSMQTITNEQRASKVLGIVFFLFLLMWCPFFITNISSVLCNSCDKEVFQKLMGIFVWIGYVSSGVNPLVYTLFNKTFREAFSRYMTCNYRTTKPIRALRKRSSRISFRSSVAENSKLFVMHGMRNGINPIMYQSPMRLRSSPIQASSAILLDTLLLTENEVDKTEEQVSYV